MKTDFLLEQTKASRRPLSGGVDAARRRELDRLVRQLGAPAWMDRRRAVRLLGESGHLPLEPLCQALEDRDERVKLAAVAELAALGNPRAVPALIAALKRTLNGGSGRRHVFVRHLVLAATVGGVLGAMAGSLMMAGTLWGVLLSTTPSWLILANHWLERAARASLQRSLIEALATLAEKDPVPELRVLLPDLRALAASRLQSEETRKALTAATSRIAAITTDIERLPIAAGAPVSGGTALPRPSHPNRGDLAALPRAAVNESAGPHEQ